MRRGLRAAVVALLALASVGPAPAGALTAVATGSISGTVTDARGAIAGVCVAATDASTPSLGSTGVFGTRATTGADGRYEIRGVAPGSYTVSFRDCEGNAHLEQWFRGAPTAAEATPVTVGVVAPKVTGIDAVLEDNVATIRGTVSSQTTGGPVAGACVDVLDAAATETIAKTTSAQDGTYSVAVLAGAYKVRFSGCGSPWTYVDEWYAGAATAADATLVTVAYGETREGVDAIVGDAAGSVSGHIRKRNGKPVGGMCVTAHAPDGTQLGATTSAADGSYRIAGVRAGDVRASLTACSGDEFLTTWFERAPSLVEATPITVEPGRDTPNVDMTPVKAGAVNGRVTFGGSGAGEVCVRLEAADDGRVVATATTDATGAYAMTGLAHVSGVVHFEDCSGGARGLVPTWFPGVDSRTAATVLAIQGPKSGVDVSMTDHAAVVGLVTLEGSPAPSMCVDVYARGAETPTGSAITGADGRFRVGGLRTGTGEAFVRDCGAGVGRSGWYAEMSATRADADPFSVVDGTATDLGHIELATTGGITGVVTNVAGSPLSLACVRAHDGAGTVVAEDRTDAYGLYALTGLAPGEYAVEFSGCDAGVFDAEWFDDATTIAAATPVHVERGRTTSGVDAVLTRGGALRGRVVDETGAGIANVCVGASTPYTAGEPPQYRSTMTAPDGAYELLDLAPSPEYRVQFTDCAAEPRYVSEWYDDRASSFDATPVTVTRGAVTVLEDAVLALGGRIEGTVVDESGNPLASVCVSASGTSYWSSSTGEDGRYSIGIVAPGSYRVQFRDCAYPSRGYTEEYWNDAVSWTTATPVLVTGGEVTVGIDAQMGRGSSISGTVTTTTGAGLSGICINAQGAPGGYVYTQTTATGQYVLNGLPAGSYRLYFYDCAYPSRGYLAEWWRDATWYGDATLVDVAAATRIEGIDVALELGASVRGTVRGPDGAPLADVCVQPSSGSPSSGPLSTRTAADGTYALVGLRAGTYNIQFTDCATTPRNLAPEWWDDAATAAGATTLDLHYGEVVTGIDAALERGGSITGTVRDASGAAVAGICVSASSPTSGTSANTRSDAAGAYALVGLRSASDYVVYFFDCRPAPRYLSEYFHDATYDTAARLTVTLGQATTGVDETLTSGATISGTITSPNGAASNACVSAFLGTREITARPTGADGRYSITGLAAGRYRLRVRDCGYPTPQNLAPTWFGGGNGRTSTAVDVADGEVVDGVDAAMAAGGTVSGVVRAEDTGAPLAQVCVNASTGASYYATGGARQAVTNAAGEYTIVGLASGDYHLEFFRCGTGYDYAREWYDGARARLDATTVAVTAGAATDGIDASLARYATLAGRVTHEGAPIAGACVTASDERASFSGWARVSQDGTWSVPLPAGEYTVTFEDCENGDNRDLVRTHAGLVTLAAAATVHLGDTEVARGGRVSGAVAAPAPGDVCVDAIDAGGTVRASTRTSWSDGTYTIVGVPEGSVKIRMKDCSYFRHLEAWHGGADEASAAWVTVRVDETTSGVDAVMQKGASISGRVIYGAEREGAAGVCVSIHDVDGTVVSRSGSAADGSWSAGALRDGSYRVQFVDCTFGGLATEWWQDAATIDTAIDVVVAGGVVLPDALLEAS